mgnify:CR=1 FL=1
MGGDAVTKTRGEVMTERGKIRFMHVVISEQHKRGRCESETDFLQAEKDTRKRALAEVGRFLLATRLTPN